MAEGSVSVLVSVGTDKHPFDRLVGWVDRWAAAHPDVSVFVQHGTSDAPRIAQAAALIPHADLLDMIAAADVVISHGGPATVMDVRACGRRPIVVGRDPERNEHIDAHQLRFAEHLAKHGLADLASTEAELHELIDRGLADPANSRLDTASGASAPGIIAFTKHMNTLLGVPTEATA
ncbi:MAG: glycosyl transferase family 28 [Acidimicrobiales bacterium]|nr:glycosyl transferase family 28 [Acidimicrobiales bacterium]